MDKSRNNEVKTIPNKTLNIKIDKSDLKIILIENFKNTLNLQLIHMYKKEIFRDLDKKYNSHLYTGLLGILMNYCHKKLENFKSKNDTFDKILEIGAGSAPHYNYIKHIYNDKKYVIECFTIYIILNKRNKSPSHLSFKLR